MMSSCNELIQTPGICNGIQSENCMKQIAYAQFFDFIESLDKNLKKIKPFYEENPQCFEGNIAKDSLDSLLETFDSSIDLFSNVIKANANSTKDESSIISSVFATMFTNYMRMTADLFSHDFPNNSVSPFIGMYANLQKVYIDILRNAQIASTEEEGNVNITRFKSVWNRHYLMFTDLPSLIKTFDFPSFSQKLDNIYQYTKNFTSDDGGQQQILMIINNLSYSLKSIKEKLFTINEKMQKTQIQDLLNEMLSFQEYIQSIGPSQLNTLHMSTMYSLISNLQLTISILNISEYLERVNQIISRDNFSIDVTKFATKDIHFITIKHIAQSMVFELNCLVRLSTKSIPVSIKRTAQAIYLAIKSNHVDLNEKFEKLAEAVNSLTPQIDLEYEHVFMSTMGNVRSPETVFESFKSTLKKEPKSLEDHCTRLLSFFEFENAANLINNESNDIIKFKEYLINNIITIKIQEIIPIFEDQISRVEGNLTQLACNSRMSLISSYCRSIILHLHRMIAEKRVPSRSRLFIKMFTLFMEFIEMIINRGIPQFQFNQLIQNIAFPTPNIIKRSLFNSSEISNLRMLISKIQTCQSSITKTATIIFDRFSNCKGNDDSYFQIDQANGKYILDNKDVFSHQVGLFDQCDEYIKQLFILLDNHKNFSSFFSIYSKFYETIGQSPLSFKVTQKQTSKISIVLAKNIPIFVRCLIKFLKIDQNEKSFLRVSSAPHDLYATVLIFLKSIYLNENNDHSNLFLHVLDSIPILNFSHSLNEFLMNLNRVEVIILSSKSFENIADNIKDYRECTSIIIRSIISGNLNINELNRKIDRFLAALFYLSPKIFAKVEECFTSITYFLRQLENLKLFIESLSHLTSEYNFSTQTFNFNYSDIIFKNFVSACAKVIKKISKSEFLPYEITNYLLGFSTVITDALPKRLFEKVDYFHIVTIYQAFMNLYTSSVSFYQSTTSPLSFSSILPPPPPVSLFSSSNTFSQQSPMHSSSISSSSSVSNLTNSNDSNSTDQSSALSLPSLQLTSLWFMNNFDFVQKIQPLLTSLASLVSSVDDNSHNMKILIKMNETIRKLDKIINPNNYTNNDNENEDDKELKIIDGYSKPAESSNLNYKDENNERHLFMSKFAFTYKLQKLLKKINFEYQISQCQFIEIYTSLESFIDTEINILHMNRLLMFSNFLLYERLINNIQLIKSFKFTKCSKLSENVKRSSKSNKSNKTNANEYTKQNEYDEDETEKSEETGEVADYEEEADDNEKQETKQDEGEEKEVEIKKDNDEDEAEYEEDHDEAESQKEEEDHEYGEDNESGDSNDYGEYDDFQEFRMRSAISNPLRRSNINGLGNTIMNNESHENILYSNNNNKNKNFFQFNFARRVDIDNKYIANNKNNKLKITKEISNSNSRNSDNNNSDNNDNDLLNEPFNPFPFFCTNENSDNQNIGSFYNNENVNEFDSDQPFRSQLQEMIENSELMLSEIGKLIESSSQWIHGPPLDTLVPLIPLSDAASDVNRELHSTIDSIYQQISTFDKSNGDLIEEAKDLMQRNTMKQNGIRAKQQELIDKMKEFARSKNVLTYTYALAIKNYEKMKTENMKKRYELQKLNSKLQLSMKMNNYENDDQEKGSNSNDDDNSKNSTSNDDRNENNSCFEDSDYDDSGHPMPVDLSDSSETSKRFTNSGQNLIIEPFVPVSIVANIGSAPIDLDSANQTLNEALIKNERLKGLLQASNSILQNQRMMHRKSKQTFSNNNNNDNNKNTNNDVIDQYFGQIALIKSFSENLDKPISSEVDVDEEGESLIKAISDFRKNSTESRQTFREASKDLLRKLDKMISIYRIQKDRTDKVKGLIRAAKATKDDYRTALSKLLDDKL